MGKPYDDGGDSCGNVVTMNEVENDETKKGKHFIMKVNGKQGEKIQCNDKVKIITATPLYTGYDIAYSKNYYVFYECDDKIHDENVKEWVISGDVKYGSEICLQLGQKYYLTYYKQWAAKANDKSVNKKWVLEKA